MSWIDSLTPKYTEEVRPGLFIQSSVTRKGLKYKQIYPAAWNGKINWKNLITGGPNFWSVLLWFGIILFLSYSYYHDVSELSEFNEVVNNNKFAWCSGVPYEELKNGGVIDVTKREGIFTLYNNPE